MAYDLSYFTALCDLSISSPFNLFGIAAALPRIICVRAFPSEIEIHISLHYKSLELEPRERRGQFFARE